jgi:hypothetical protein
MIGQSNAMMNRRRDNGLPARRNDGHINTTTRHSGLR